MNDIKSLGQDPRFEALKRLAEEMIDKIKDEQFQSKSTQWETTVNFLEASGQIKGIRRFIQEICNQALND